MVQFLNGIRQFSYKALIYIERMKKFSTLAIFAQLFLGMVLLTTAQAYADASVDPLIEGAKLCTRHLPRYEREFAIPTHLLSAIASTESGRYHEGLKIKLPWPWTINVGGKGYFYDSKDQAIAAVRKLRAQGIQSIDVGCMQVNLFHHAKAFMSLDQAFEPEANIAYAASFLRGLYNEEGTWKKAAADYHSRTPKLGAEYVGLVYDSWFNIIDKLRAARLHVPESAIAGMNELKSPTYETGKPVYAAQNRLPEQQGKKVAMRTHPHMNSISVATTTDTTSENGILVVRPEPVAAPVAMAMAQYKPSAGETTAPKIVHIDDSNATDAPVTPHKNGPNFIFSD